jgi:acetyltransferase
VCHTVDVIEQIQDVISDCASTRPGLALAPIRPEDQPGLRSWLASVSPESRYARFLGYVTELSPKQWHYLTEVDGHDHAAFVARRAEEIAGVGRWIRFPEDPELAEIAFLIGDAHQRTGVGSALMDRLIEEARAHGVRRFRGYVLPHNRGIRRLLARPPLERLRDTGRLIDVQIRGADQMQASVIDRAGAGS